MLCFPHAQILISDKESVQRLGFTWLSTSFILNKWTGSWSNSLPNSYWRDPRFWYSFGGTSALCFCTSVKASFCLEWRTPGRKDHKMQGTNKKSKSQFCFPTLQCNYKSFVIEGKVIYREMHLDMLLRTIYWEGVHLHSRAQIRASLCLLLE